MSYLITHWLGFVSHRSSRVIQESEERYRALVEQASDGIFITDNQERFLDVNNSACDMLGFSREDMLAMHIQDVMPDEEYAKFTQIRLLLMAGETLLNEWHMKCRDGSLIPVEVSAKILSDGRIQGIARNITERKHHEAQLIHLASHDPLTGLPNRSLFQDRLQQAIVKARRNGLKVAVLFCDLDRFKRINDSLGHDVGDQLLQTVAGRLLGSVRESDTIARLGGDEFAIILDDFATEDAVSGIAQKILFTLARPLTIATFNLSTTSSIGISFFPEDGDTAQTLLKNADAAMYLAKARGKNNFQFYSQGIASNALEHLNLEIDLRLALEREELVLHYQPQVDLKSGRVIGAEALLRWRRSEGGMTLPAQLIPLAEETGLIGPIGEWVLRTACLQNKAWQNAGLPGIRVAVNLSAKQFMHQDLVQIVERALDETGLEARYLELEITESSLMQKSEDAVVTLSKLKAMGIHLSIDDFGTGYSSLSYLQRFPIDTLKIDQSFVYDIATNQAGAVIIQAVIALAHAMKLRVIAEGVEAAYQIAFLAVNRCDAMQGYYVSHHLPADGLTAFLQKRYELHPQTVPQLRNAKN
ncbi:MAG TPA: GGDEF domain-containing protein [Betaproteobacteria bacterium]|nr:GGDEF domain-containing protein [Betaproteobacteria bacterium]